MPILVQDFESFRKPHDVAMKEVHFMNELNWMSAVKL